LRIIQPSLITTGKTEGRKTWGIFGWLPECATPNIRQIMAARESLVNKIKTTFVAKFGKKMSL
jgi:hypothetical protein